MTNLRYVVIGASAGGIDALCDFFRAVPPELPAAYFVVQHLSPNYQSALAAIIGRCTTMKTIIPKDGHAIEPNCVYIAPPDHHLLIDECQILVKRGPKENRFRPSIDALFRSAAYVRGSSVIGIVLSGALDDGTSGLWTVKRLRGITMVQDPRQAEFDDMPSNALRQVEIDHCLPVEKIGPLLKELMAIPLANELLGTPEHTSIGIEVRAAAGGEAFREGVMEIGQLTPFTCPECHGVLVEMAEGGRRRYRCHTGHAYSMPALLSEIVEKVEASYWSAMRSLEEATMLLDQTASDLNVSDDKAEATRFREQARFAEQQSRQLREVLLGASCFDGRKTFEIEKE